MSHFKISLLSLSLLVNLSQSAQAIEGDDSSAVQNNWAKANAYKDAAIEQGTEFLKTPSGLALGSTVAGLAVLDSGLLSVAGTLVSGGMAADVFLHPDRYEHTTTFKFGHDLLDQYATPRNILLASTSLTTFYALFGDIAGSSTPLVFGAVQTILGSLAVTEKIKTAIESSQNQVIAPASSAVIEPDVSLEDDVIIALETPPSNEAPANVNSAGTGMTPAVADAAPIKGETVSE